MIEGYTKKRGFNIKRLLLFTFSILLILCVLNPCSASSGVVVTKDTVTAYGWNSCGGWYKTGGMFANYCPFCKSHGTLRYNPKHTYEGEWTCSKCDSDFCNCGRCKAGHSGVFLTKVTQKKLQSNINTSSCTPTTNTTSTVGSYMPYIIQKLNNDWSML